MRWDLSESSFSTILKFYNKLPEDIQTIHEKIQERSRVATTCIIFT
jgi:hypothetical protein